MREVRINLGKIINTTLINKGVLNMSFDILTNVYIPNLCYQLHIKVIDNVGTLLEEFLDSGIINEYKHFMFECSTI